MNEEMVPIENDAEDLQTFLRQVITEMEVSKECTKTEDKSEENTGPHQSVTSYKISRSGFDDEHPTVYMLEITTPTGFNKPTKTKLIKTWAVKNSSDILDNKQEFEFVTQHHLIGGNTKTTLRKALKTFHGEIGHFANSQNVAQGGSIIEQPLQIAKKILLEIKNPPTPIPLPVK
jgi:hypothetical protein